MALLNGSNSKQVCLGSAVSVFALLSLLFTDFVAAQVLEEVVVTAQRREQSLQEVPISIEVHSGANIELQGFRNLDDLAKFSPTVRLEVGMQEQDVTIRGLGTPGNNNVLMSATPIILDGIYFGRNVLVKTAFLDTDRVEILKGPQPLFYGLNATGGAFSIISKRPTPEWEGDLSYDFGNDGKNKMFGAIGGPLTETLGIRVAGMSDRTDGPVKNNVDPTKKVAGYNNLSGRLSLLWNPSDRWEILTKVEGTRQRNGSELRMGCLTEGAASGYVGRAGPLNDEGNTDDAGIGVYGYGSAVLAPPPSGIPYDGPPIEKLRRATGQDCFRDEFAMNVEGPYPSKPANVTGEETRTLDGGSVAYEQAANGFWGDLAGTAPEGEYPQFYGSDLGGIYGREHVNAMNAALDATYTTDSGFNINSLTGLIDFNRYDKRDNSPSPFLSNFQARYEDLAVWSEQVKVESPTYNLNIGGGSTIQVIVGGVWQEQNIDTHNYFPKDSVRRGDRANVVWEDTTWWSGFWNANFDFMEDQFSLQVGGRYTNVKKQAFYMGAASQWIFEGTPCLVAGGNPDPATCAPDTNFKRVHPELTTYTTLDPITGINSDSPARAVRVDSPIITVVGVDLDDLWTPKNWNRPIDIPLNYRSPIGQAVGYTAPTYHNREGGPFGKCDLCLDDIYSNVDGYDSQIVLSFTPNGLDRNHTFYGKYAEAFKGPASDLAPGSIPSDIADLTYDSEHSEIWELGAKGSLMNSRMRYDATAFITTFSDLQYSAAGRAFDPSEDAQTTLSLNAGRQRVKGIELGAQAAITDNLRLNMSLGLMRGRIYDFDGGGCTDDEVIAASIDALTPTSAGGSMENRSATEIATADENLDFLGASRRANLPARSDIPEELYINGGCRLEDDLDGSGFEAGTINRSGEDAARTPNWGLVLGLDYNHPILDNYIYYFNMMGVLSDGYISEETTFERKIKYNPSGDVNLTMGIGNQDRTWRLMGYARNLLRSTKSYNPEYDLLRAGIIQTENISANNFLQYGVRFEYNFR